MKLKTYVNGVFKYTHIDIFNEWMNEVKEYEWKEYILGEHSFWVEMKCLE